MSSIRSKNTLSRFVFLLCLLLVALLCWLGVWQLERAEFKRGLEDRYFDSLANLPLDEASLKLTTSLPEVDTGLAFRQLVLTGTYARARTFLIDNQIYKGRFGYRAITLFTSAAGDKYLVDRGWLAGSKERSVLPKIETPNAQISIQSVIWPNLGLVPLLESNPPEAGWPKRIQRVDLELMQSVLEIEAFPMLLRLEKFQPGVLTVVTQQVSFSADRHTGYAVQWFGLAITLFAGLIILYRRQRK